jgi:ABC-2 type transport system permease protein
MTRSNAMTTLTERPAAGARTQPQWQGTSFAAQIKILTGRSLRAIVRDPRMIVFNLLQPLVMLTLFSQIFSVVAQTPNFPQGVEYIDYLMPAILVTTALGAALQSGIGLITEMRDGVLARFRSLPIRLNAVLVARSLSDVIRTGVQLMIMMVVATALFGFSPAGGFTGVVEAWALGLAVGWGLGWLFMAVGAWLRNAELMQMVGFLLMFPLMFASTAYVPVDSLPGWLQVVANINPLSYAINAARDLALGTPVGGGVLSALTATLVLATVGFTAASRGFRKPM